MVWRTFSSLSCAFLLASLSSAQFSVGNLAVVRVGDGATSLGTTGAAVEIVEIDRATGSLTGQSINVTYSGASGLVLTGSSTGEGGFNSLATLSGSYGFLGGYAAQVGAGSLTSGTARRVLRINYLTGSFDTQDISTGGQMRATLSTTGDDFYVSGGSAGVQSGAFGSSALTNQSSEGNTRNLALGLGGALYSKASGGFQIKEAGSENLVIDLGTVLPVDFAMSSDGLTLYVSSDSTTTGGIHRFSRASVLDSWSEGVQLTTERQRHLALDETGGVHTLFATFRSGSTSTIQAFVDVAQTSSATAAWTLANGENYAYFGLDMVHQPVPEPMTLVLAAAGLAALVRRRAKR